MIWRVSAGASHTVVVNAVTALAPALPVLKSLRRGPSLRDAIDALDASAVELSFWKQDELVVLDDFVPAPIVEQMLAETRGAMHRAVRKRVWGYKSSASISCFALRELAPSILALYRSPELIALWSRLADMDLVVCPDDDPHACAIYHYDQPGDRVGYHYDTSWYEGARYTVLLGLVDDSSAKLCCDVHHRDKHRPTKHMEVSLRPGSLAFFNGDKLRHGVSPLGRDEVRTVLTLQYVSDPRMAGWRRVVSILKDALTYFGRDAFLPRLGGVPRSRSRRSR